MMRKNNLIAVLLINTFIVFLLSSCNPSKKYEKEEQAQIDDYLGNNINLSFELKESGLYYLSVQEGTGEIAAKHDTAFVKYTGKFLDGTIFDTNVGRTDTLEVPVSEGFLIEGFDEGLTYMKKGGKSVFLIPSKLAYGATGFYAIQGYTPLLFDVELVRLKRGPATK